MAKCSFPIEFGEVRGTLSKEVFVSRNERLEKRLIASVRNGKQHIYLRQYNPRRSKPSSAEMAARQRFANIAQQVNNMTDEQKNAYAKEWKRHGYKLNGKKYNTLRGYIVARLYAETNS